MKVTVHPLFFATLVFCALFGGLMETLIFLATALLHECGHIFYAARLGFTCERVRIMPYGAAAVCDLEGIRASDEVKLALAGPAVNAVICVICAGLWWFYPITYAYTDTVMSASAAMLFVNLLPAYPLDGGRVARRLLAKPFGDKAAKLIMKVVALAIAAAFIVLFFIYGYNLTCLFFALFLVCSAIEKTPPAARISFAARGKLKRGMEVKYVLVNGEYTFRQAFAALEDGRYLVLQLYCDDGIADELTQDELYDKSLSFGLYNPVFGESGFSRKERENTSPSNSPLTTELTTVTPNDIPSFITSEREE